MFAFLERTEAIKSAPDGILEGATGIIVKRFSGHYLVALGESKTDILARFPAHLVRAD